MSGAFVVNGYLAGLLALGGIVGLLGLAHVLVVGLAGGVDGDAATKRRRGIKALVVGRDGRTSTSKVQALLWTGALVYAFAFLLLWGRSPDCGDEQHRGGERCQAAHEAREAFRRAIGQPLQAEYFVLLGFPVTAALAAKALTTNKVLAGDLTKAPIDDSGAGVANGLAQLYSNDAGESDLLDFQYLAFNLLALAYFTIEFVAQPSAGIPDLPPTLVALAGVGASAYTVKKALERDVRPVITSVVPRRIRRGPGATFVVTGRGFPTVPQAGGGGTTQVLVEGVPLAVAPVPGGAAGGPTRLRAELTADVLEALEAPAAESAPVQVTVLDPAGVESEAVELVLVHRWGRVPPEGSGG